MATGRGYAVTLGQVIQVSFATPEGLTHLDGEYSSAQSLVGYTHVTGETITTAGGGQRGRHRLPPTLPRRSLLFQGRIMHSHRSCLPFILL